MSEQPGKEIRQFYKEEREILTTAGPVEFLSFKPKEIKREVPALVLPGWGETTEIMSDLTEQIAQNDGRISATLSHSRFPKSIDMKEEELVKALAINEVIDEARLGSLHAIAHSEGAINATLAALMAPEKFKSITYVGPAGIIQEKGFFSLMENYTRDFIDRILAGHPVAPTLKYILANPTKSLREAFEISQSQTAWAIKLLRAQGIKTYLVHGVDDKVFPMERMQEAASTELFDGVYSLKGDHTLPFINASTYAPVLIDILDKIDDRGGKGPRAK